MIIIIRLFPGRKGHFHPVCLGVETRPPFGNYFLKGRDTGDSHGIYEKDTTEMNVYARRRKSNFQSDPRDKKID